jgi:hypothetical protein
MANWKHTLDLSDIWNSEPNSELYTEISKRLTAKAAEMKNAGTITEEDYDDLCDVSDDIQSITDVEDFDNLWDEVYDWADHDHRLWIKTFWIKT